MTAFPSVPERAFEGSEPGELHALQDYAIFGGVLRSAMELPELLRVRPVGRPDWRFDVVAGEPPEVPLTLLGERQLGLEWYRLHRAAHGLRLEYSHAGSFDIAADGGRVIWYQREDVLLERVRNILVGPVLALALERMGHLCLHGSAVALGDRAIAFVGPKYHGKSTLATALVAAGARLVADNLLAVFPGPPALVRPGVASVRLWEDAVDALPLSTICDARVPGVKVTATGFDAHLVMRADSTLAGVYVLAPVTRLADGGGFTRTPLVGAAAAVALAQQRKLADELIGFTAAARRLAIAAAVARTVPVWALHVVRDFGRLDALAEQIIDWHRVHDQGALPTLPTPVEKP